MNKTTKLKNTCPNCKYKTDITGTPTEGDFSLCSRCGEILQFDAALGLSLASIQDLQEFRQRDRISYTQLLQSQIAIRLLKNGRKRF